MTNTNVYLEKYDIEDLQQLAVNANIENSSSLNKEALITEITSNLTSDYVLEYTYLYSDDKAIDSWRQASRDKEKSKDLKIIDIYGLYIMGLAYEELTEEDNFFIIEEILPLFEKVDTEENREKRLNIQRQLNLIRASLHLYGVVEFTQLTKLFKKYYGMEVKIEDIVNLINQSPYVITVNEQNKELIIDDMTEEQYQIIRQNQQKHQYYEPEFAKFIKFSDPNYIDESDAHHALKDWIREHLNTETVSDNELYIQLLRMIISGQKRQDIVDEINNLGYDFPSTRKEDDFFRMVNEIIAHTRHFQYRGKTKSELGQKTIVKEIKVGRNDPCPCGSGKKYKKCCGKAV